MTLRGWTNDGWRRCQVDSQSLRSFRFRFLEHNDAYHIMKIAWQVDTNRAMSSTSDLGSPQGCVCVLGLAITKSTEVNMVRVSKWNLVSHKSVKRNSCSDEMNWLNDAKTPTAQPRSPRTMYHTSWNKNTRCEQILCIKKRRLFNSSTMVGDKNYSCHVSSMHRLCSASSPPELLPGHGHSPFVAL